MFWNFGFVSLVFGFMSRYSMDLCLSFGWKVGCVSGSAPAGHHFFLSLELFWFTVGLGSADVAFKGGILSRDGASPLTPIVTGYRFDRWVGAVQTVHGVQSTESQQILA